MNPVHVLCTRNFSDQQLDRLRAISPRIVVQQIADVGRDSAKLTATLSPDVNVLYTTAAPLSLENAPNLQWIQASGAGINNFTNSPVWHSSIMLTNASGVAAVTIAEHVLMMMLALSRRLPDMVALQQQAEWSRAGSSAFIQRELRGSTASIVGYGSIGREVARLCRSFGMRVVAVKRSPESRQDSGYRQPGTGDPAGDIPEEWMGPGDLHRALGQADFAIVTVPSTHDTAGLFGPAEFEAMPTHASLINVARGDVVDQSALIEALQGGQIAGAALDVTDPEPLPAASPLWQLDNVIISPHVAGPGPRYGDYVADLFADNLRRFVEGEPLYNRVDFPRGY